MKTTATPTPFGILLKKARQAQRMTLRSLAAELADVGFIVDISYLHAVECGLKRYVAAERWFALGRALQVPRGVWLRAAIRSGYIGYDPATLTDGEVEVLIALCQSQRTNSEVFDEEA